MTDVMKGTCRLLHSKYAWPPAGAQDVSNQRQNKKLASQGTFSVEESKKRDARKKARELLTRHHSTICYGLGPEHE